MRPTLILLALVLSLAACSGGSGDRPGPSPATPGEPYLLIADGPINEPGLTVAEALGHQPMDDLVTVSGALFVDLDGTVMLCDAIAESFPPQCGGERIRVEGLDLAAVPGLQEASGVQWAESVTLFGSVE